MPSSSTPADVEELKAKIQELITVCPITQDNPVGCQLHSIRQMSDTGRAVWLASLSADELQQIATRHHACMQTRVFMQSFD
jgi:uncharacterized protein YaaW (UPF0174 family)